MKRILITLIIISKLSPILIAQQNSVEDYDILFIGSSYFNFNDLPGKFSALCEASGKNVVIDQYIPCGLFLSDHASSDITAEKINQQDWDFVVLQGCGITTAYPEIYPEHPVFASLQ